MDSQVKHQASRMYRLGLDYFNSAEALANLTLALDSSSSSTLLRILSFEIFLKCSIVIQNGLSLPKGHDYVKLFNTLNPETRACIISVALERCLHDSFERLSNDLEKTLNHITHAFTSGRYSYELCFQLTPEEIRNKEIKWEESGSSIDNADYAYLPNETYSLAWALKRHIEEQLGITQN